MTTFTDELTANPELEMFSLYTPNGYALVGDVIMSGEPAVGDYFVAGISDDTNEGTWSAYMKVTDSDPEFKTYIGIEIPLGGAADGVTMAPDFYSNMVIEFLHPEIEGTSGGLGGVLGQSYSRQEWQFWSWSFDSDDADTILDLNAWIGQYDSATDTFFAFNDFITLSFDNANSISLQVGVLATVVY